MPEDKEGPAKSGFVGSVANLANAAIGGGVLAFPLAFMATGYIMGFIVSFAFAAIMWFTLHILGRAADLTGETSYQGLVARVLGPTAGKIISVSMTVYLFGACVAYMNIVSDQVYEPILAKVEGVGPLGNRQFVIFLFSALIIVPLCLMRSVKNLEITSTLAVVSICYLAADVMYHADEVLTSAGVAASAHPFRLSVQLFQAVPIICFALQCHLVYVPVYANLDRPSLARMDWIAVATFIVCLCLYLPVGVLGYLMYGSGTADDISENLPVGVDTYVVHGCLAATALFSYPLLHYVARIAVADVVWGDGAGDAITAGEEAGDEEAASRAAALCPGVCGTLRSRTATPGARGVTYYGITAAFIGLTMGLAMALPGIKVVLEFTGSTAAVVQIFVFPGLMYMKLARLARADATAATAALLPAGPGGSLNALGGTKAGVPGLGEWGMTAMSLSEPGAGVGWALIVFGLAMGAVSLGVTIDNLVRGA